MPSNPRLWAAEHTEKIWSFGRNLVLIISRKSFARLLLEVKSNKTGKPVLIIFNCLLNSN